MEAEARPRTYLEWILSALGPYGLLLPLVGLVAFALALFIVIRGRGPMAGAALVFIVPMPLALGLFAAAQAAINSFSVVALGDIQLKSSDVAQTISECLVLPEIGMLLTVPAYLVALIGLVVRSLRDDAARPPAPPR